MFYCPSGDAVLTNSSTLTLAIEANDDAHGLFRFSGPYTLYVEEGAMLRVGFVIFLPKSISICSITLYYSVYLLLSSVIRDRGRYKSVNVTWQLSNNDTLLTHNQDFTPASGHVVFNEGEQQQFIDIAVNADREPEFDEVFIIQLLNTSG